MTDLYPMQPVKLDPHGVARFEANPIIEMLIEEGSIDLNKIAVWCAMNDIDNKYQEQLAQLIGYSISGYGTLSYVSDESYERANKQFESLPKTWYPDVFYYHGDKVSIGKDIYKCIVCNGDLCDFSYGIYPPTGSYDWEKV